MNLKYLYCMKEAKKKRVYIVWCHLYKSLENANLSIGIESGSMVFRCQDRGKKGMDYQGVWGNFGGDGYVHYFNRGDGFMVVYICQNSSNRTL